MWMRDSDLWSNIAFPQMFNKFSNLCVCLRKVFPYLLENEVYHMALYEMM